MSNAKTKNILLTAMFMAIGMVLPFFTGQIRSIGNMLLPMHIPIFLCSLICGWQYGLAAGALLPLLRSFAFGMPVLYPDAAAMAFELAAYGFISGFLYFRSQWKCIKSLYKSMITAMIAGRIIWGIAKAVLLGIGGEPFTLYAFAAGAFINAIPGIILQLIIVPAVMVALHRAKLVPLVRKKK